MTFFCEIFEIMDIFKKFEKSLIIDALVRNLKISKINIFFNFLKSDDSLFYTRSGVSTSSDSGAWSTSAKSLDTEDYKKWKKVELIDDLVYYRDREHELTQGRLTCGFIVLKLR